MDSRPVRGRKSSQASVNESLSRLFLQVFGLIPLFLISGCTGLISGKQQTASTAGFSVSPASVSFGKVTTGQKISQTVTLTNTRKTAVTIQQAKASSAQFGISGITLPMSVAAGQSASFSVWFNGAAAGNVTGTLTVQGDAGTKPAVINLNGTVTSSPQAQLTLTPAAIEFGTVSVGSKNTVNLALGNSGSTDLTISVISLNGAEFGISGVATPRTISAGHSVPVTVSFSPTAAGSASGSIAFTSNDPANPTASLTLNGTGSTAPLKQLTANPSTLSFGSVATGSEASQIITLTNTGNTQVQIASLTVGGNAFSVSGMTALATLNASQSASLNVHFAPTASGNASGTLTIASDASGSPLTITLFGTGTQAGLNVSPASSTFGSVVDGQTKSQNFTLTNTGTAALTVTQISATGAGYSANGLTMPATIAAGQTATFSVLFAPTTAGILNGSVSITSNAPNSPNSVALSGTGVAASVTISTTPSSLNFGAVTAGSTSTKSITVTNTGNSNMTISQINVSAKDVIATGITTPVTLAAGKNAAMNLVFSPKSAETVTGNVTVTSSQGSSAVIPVTASGVQSGLTITPASVNFGNVTLGVPNSQTIQLSNNGTGVLTVTQLAVTGSGFTSSSLNLPLSLNPGATSTFNVQLAPQTPGTASGSVSIISNAPTSPTTVPLSGSGVAASTTVSLSTSSLSFGSVNAGNTATQSVTISDTGNANVTISGISVTGTGFTMSGAGTPVTLSPSQKLTIGVQFAPSAAGSDIGSVTITSNATGSPAVVALSGTGVALTQHSVMLTWNASTSTVSGYNVYRSAVSGSTYSKVNSSLVGNLSYTDASVQSSLTYYYVTTAVDSSGNESAYSNEAQAVIP